MRGEGGGVCLAQRVEFGGLSDLSWLLYALLNCQGHIEGGDGD